MTTWTRWGPWLAAVALAVAPLLWIRPVAGEEVFLGADDQARQLIESLDASYDPWFRSLWEPPSGEVASLLFALQAAVGASVVAWTLGYWRGRRRRSSGSGAP